MRARDSGTQLRCCTNPQWPWRYQGLSFFVSNPAECPKFFLFQGIHVSPQPKTLQCLPMALRLKAKPQPRPAVFPSDLAPAPPSKLTSSHPPLFTPVQHLWTSFCSVNTTNLFLPQRGWSLPILQFTCYLLQEAFLTFPI